MSENTPRDQHDTEPIPLLNGGGTSTAPEPGEGIWFGYGTSQDESTPDNSTSRLWRIIIAVSFAVLLIPAWVVFQYNPGWISSLILLGAILLVGFGLWLWFGIIWAIGVLASAGFLLELGKIALSRDWQNVTALCVCLVILGLVALRLKRGSLKKAELVEARRLAEERHSREGGVQVPKPSRRARKAITTTDHLILEFNQHPLALIPWVAVLVVGPIVLLHFQAQAIFVLWLIGGVVVLYRVIGGGLLGATNIRRAWLLTPWLIVLGGMTYLLVKAGDMVTQVLWLLIIVSLSASIADWKYNRWCITTLQLIPLTGFLTEHISEMPLAKVNDVVLDIPRWSKWLAYLRLIKTEVGTLTIVSAAETRGKYRFTLVPNVRHVHNVLTGKVIED